MNNKIMFSSGNDNYKTPSVIYQYYMNLGYSDPCPYNENYIDNLDQNKWDNENQFINPPYSNVKKWVLEAIKFNKRTKKQVVMLLASRTDTIWFHELLKLQNVEFIFIKGRLKFGDSKNNAPFPSVIIKIKGGDVNECINE